MLDCPIKYKTNNTKKYNIIHALSINKLIALHLYLASFVLSVHSLVCVCCCDEHDIFQQEPFQNHPSSDRMYSIPCSRQQSRRQKTLENTFPCIISSSGTMRSNRGSSLSVIIASSVEGYHIKGTGIANIRMDFDSLLSLPDARLSLFRPLVYVRMSLKSQQGTEENDSSVILQSFFMTSS